MYLGLGLLIGSPSTLLLVLLLSLLLLVYIRFVEEKEMFARFGDDYLEYRQRTPFLIPRPGRRGDGT